MGETSANAATYIAAPMTQPSEPSTEAGKALLAEDYGTTDPRANEPWFEKTRSEYAKRILAIEAEAVAPWRKMLAAVERRVMPDRSPCYCNERINSEADHLPTCRAARSLLQADEPK